MPFEIPPLDCNTDQKSKWRTDFLEGMKSRWLAKLTATTMSITVFFVLYFWTLRHPFRQVTLMPMMRIDRVVEFQEWALTPYVSLWIYIPLLPSLMRSVQALLKYAQGAVLLGVTGLLTFAIWPTSITTPDIDFAQHPSAALLRRVDASGNACPSLHVAFAVFNLIGFERFLTNVKAPNAIRIANLLWSLAITYSTVAIKQHVFIDVVAGALLGATVAAWTFKNTDQIY